MNNSIPEQVQKKSRFWMTHLIIPTEVVADKDLSPSEKMLFSAIQILDSPSKGCFACNEYLGILVDLSPGSVSVGISKLKRKKFILSNGMTNERRIIWINPEYKIIHRSNCEELENKINDFYVRKEEKSAYLKINRPHIEKSIPYNNSIKVINSSLEKPKELNNTRKDRVSSRGSRKDDNKNTPELPIKSNSLLSKTLQEPIKCTSSHYVEYWNALSNVSHHSYFNNKDKPSKTYLTAHKLCLQLRRGMFNKNPLDKSFLLKHKINNSLLTKKFSKKEIENILTNISLMFAPGHWAGNGNGLKSNLSSLLYNPMNQSSMFLAMFTNPSMAEKTLKYKKPKNNYPQLTKKIMPLLDEKPKDNKQFYLLFKGIESIVTYHKTIKINKGSSGLSNVNAWIDYFIDFLECSCNNIQIQSSMIRTNHWLWDRFINEYEREWYVDLRDSQRDYSEDIVY